MDTLAEASAAASLLTVLLELQLPAEMLSALHPVLRWVSCCCLLSNVVVLIPVDYASCQGPNSSRCTLLSGMLCAVGAISTGSESWDDAVALVSGSGMLYTHA